MDFPGLLSGCVDVFLIFYFGSSFGSPVCPGQGLLVDCYSRAEASEEWIIYGSGLTNYLLRVPDVGLLLVKIDGDVQQLIGQYIKNKDVGE